MKRHVTCMSVLFFWSAFSAWSDTNLWAEAEVWSGSHETTLVGGFHRGYDAAQYTNGARELIDDNLYCFRGSSSASSGFGHMSTTLFMWSISNSYPIQYVAARTGFTNTIAVCGPTGTGAVSYYVSSFTVDQRSGAGWGTASDGFDMTHNGQSVPFSIFINVGSSLVYTSSPQPIIFGVPFTISGTISSRLDGPQTSSFELSTTYHEYAYQLHDMIVMDAQGTILSNHLTKTSESGTPYPQGPTLFVMNGSHTNLTFFWHSITEKVYQLQFSTNLLEDLWTDMGNTVLGKGTTNVIDAPITDDLIRFYRLSLP